MLEGHYLPMKRGANDPQWGSVSRTRKLSAGDAVVLPCFRPPLLLHVALVYKCNVQQWLRYCRCMGVA